jgi:hypothetical protein
MDFPAQFVALSVLAAIRKMIASLQPLALTVALKIIRFLVILDYTQALFSKFNQWAV